MDALEPARIEVFIDEDGVHTWPLREYEWCVVCFERACEEGSGVCNGCLAERPNP